MWRLTIEDDEGKRTPLPLFRDEYTVGRSEENTIRLTERNISRRHAVLRRAGAGWVVVDLRSYNGSYVNGIRVAGETALEHGDVVQLGDYRVEVSDESLVEPTSAAGADLNAGAAKQDRLVMVAGPVPGQEFPIVSATMLIGRAAEVDVSIPHISVSRVHAEIHALGAGRYEIIDKASANGVRVNGSQLGRALIEAGDYIELGEVRLKFVGAGQVYWPGAEAMRLLTEPRDSATLRPASGSSPARPRARDVQSSSGSAIKTIGIGATGALLALGGLFAFQSLRTRTDRPNPPASEPTVLAKPADPVSFAVEEAKRLASAGSIDAAHARLTSAIPPGSPLRESADVREVEGRWADTTLALADQENDPSARRALLNSVAQSAILDMERRRVAADRLRELDERGKEPRDLPQAATTARPTASVKTAPPPKATAEPTAPRPSRPPVLAADPWAPGGGATQSSTTRTSGTTRDSRREGGAGTH